tara:strand:- start:1800 stop:3671 length:1872 start_codon:yes stop_codon:yes gene_type:complete
MAEIIPGTQKFHTLDKDNVTKDLGSKQLQGMREIYTMDDITATAVGSIGVPTDLQYDTVAFMQAATPDVGKYATTLGYTTPGDGGGSLYIVEATDPADTRHSLLLANGNYAVSIYDGITNPTQWGAIPSLAGAAVGNAAAFNEMFAHVQAEAGDLSVNVLTGSYYIGATVLLPQSYVSPSDSFEVHFNGSTLLAAADGITLLSRTYYTNQESGRVDIYSVNVDGNGYSNVTGINIQGAYATKIDSCGFSGLAVGLNLGWALATKIDQCLFGSCLRGCNIGLEGANGNHQSNVCQVNNCRFYSPAAADYALYIDRVSGTTVMNTIFEGFHPTNADAYFDGNSSTVNDCTFDGCHAESAGNATSGDNTFIEFTGGATLSVLRVFAQSPVTGTNPNGREILWIKGGGRTELSMYYWANNFSIRNDVNGNFYMPDTVLNYTLPVAADLDWTGTYGEPLYFEIMRSNTGQAASRFRGTQSEILGGGLWETHEVSGIDRLAEMKTWANTYNVYDDPGLRGCNWYHVNAFDQKVAFTNNNYGIADTATIRTILPLQHPNKVTYSLAAGVTGSYDQTLCPSVGQTVVFNPAGVPGTSVTAGVQGEIRSDATHTYICVSDNNWVRFLNTASW